MGGWDGGIMGGGKVLPGSEVMKQPVLNSWIGTLESSGKRRTSQFR